MSLDAETNEMLQKGNDVTVVLGMPGWKVIYEMAMERIMDLQSIENILPDAPTDQIIIDLKARKMAIATLLDFLKSVNAFALNANAVQDTLQKPEAFGHIQRI